MLTITNNVLGTCYSDDQTDLKNHKRCKRQMSGCPGLRSGSGRCTGCHMGSGGMDLGRGCQGCSFGNGNNVGGYPPVRRWHAVADAPSSNYQNYNWNSYPSNEYGISTGWNSGSYAQGSPMYSALGYPYDQNSYPSAQSNYGSGWSTGSSGGYYDYYGKK